MAERIIVPTLLLVLLLAFGCSSNYRLKHEAMEQPSAWPFYHGDRAASGTLENGSFNGKLNILWETSTTGKPAGPVTIYYNILVYPDTKKKIRYYDIFTGEYLGKLKCKGIPQTGLVIKDSLAYYSLAPRKDYLRCINLLNNHLLWKRHVKDAAAGSIILENSLIISSGEGLIAAFDIVDGRLLWQADTEGRIVAPVSYRDGKLFQPGVDGKLYVLSATNGRELYRIEAPGPLASPVIADKLVYAADITGHVSAYDPVDGRSVWQVKLSGPIWNSPVLAGERLFIGHSGGGLVALEAASGRELWRFETGEVIKASPIAVGEFVIAGTMTGKLFVLKASDGSPVDERQLTGAIALAPVTDGRRVFAVTQKGKIICFGEKNDKPIQTDQ
ncbi:MAG: PQQ-binding-like beta-propeller repeat protein [candidate division Zixibacteria bacterium]|nr:PQQ-binding-like beta-propeller repeat protein [candidate division Zixibacteria bacterium]